MAGPRAWQRRLRGLSRQGAACAPVASVGFRRRHLQPLYGLAPQQGLSPATEDRRSACRRFRQMGRELKFDPGREELWVGPRVDGLIAG
ncbi:hypothetical protein HMPREF0185_02468 [Brevundimonas diminuta 470-4]|nr:hypothetical protein HMPREF0185_02468 [Brevundimonas diminuta 470-4]